MVVNKNSANSVYAELLCLKQGKTIVLFENFSNFNLKNVSFLSIVDFHLDTYSVYKD